MEIKKNEENIRVESIEFVGRDKLLKIKDNIKNIDNKNNFSSKKILMFKNIKFINCIFREIDLGFSEIHNCEFENCMFIDISWKGSTFKDCLFHDVEIIQSNFRETNIDKTIFLNCVIQDTTLSSATFNECSYLLFLKDCNLVDTVFKNNYQQFEISFLHKDNSILGLNTKIEKYDNKGIHYIDELVLENMRLSNDISYTYYEFAIKFKQNNLMDKYGDFFYLYKRAEHKTKKGFDRIKSNFYYITCGYGEKPFRTLFLAIFIIICCAILYSFMGLNINNKVLKYSIDLTNIDGFIDYLYDLRYFIHFSIVTFTTVGYGNIVPINGSVIVSSIEMALGVILVGLFVSTLVRVMAR